MKNHSSCAILWLSFAVGMVNAGQASVALRSPKAVATPQLIHMASVPDARTLRGKYVQDIPFSYDLAQSRDDQAKVKSPLELESPTNVMSKGPRVSVTTGAPAPPPTPLLNTGTNFNGPSQNGYIPYSAAIAVGPNHVIVMSNAQFAIYTKAGALISLTQNSQFFPTDAGVNRNPNCHYDLSGHFVMLTAQAQNPRAFMNIAVSQSSDPTGAWWIYHLDWTLDGATQTSNWGDWPTVGYDDNAVYIAANQFSFANIYQYSKIRVLSKSELFTGGSANWTDFTDLRNADGTSAFCVKPGRMLSSSASEYLLNNRPGGGSSITLWRIDNAPTGPTLTHVAEVSLGTYSVPPDGRQPGRKSPYIATGDCRLQDVIMQNGFLYTAFNTNYGTAKTRAGSGIRYLMISTSGGISKNMMFFTAGIDYYYPAVSVDPSGNMIMVFSRSSVSEYASMYKTGMMTTETGIETPTLVKAGQGLVINGRWGEYNGIHNDPSNSGTIWMYCGWEQSNNTWASYIASTSYGVPATTQPGANVEKGITRSFALNANYPNPFNPSTVISYTLPEEIYARLVVYDALGRQVATVADGVQSAGSHQVTFDAAGLSSGIYYYGLEAGKSISISKMILAK